jgi:hypothetical protein
MTFAPIHRVPLYRYVQLVTPDARGHLPTLYCPRRHVLRFRVKCWSEFGFRCGHDLGPGHAPCDCTLWLISLPQRTYALCEVTEEELREMERARMGYAEQLAYLFRPERLFGVPRRAA